MKGKIHIEGFKCFLDIDIPISGLTVFAGGNSVGKSSVIQALLLLRSAFEKRHNKDQQITLNEDFRLFLGNSAEVLAREAASEKIFVEYFLNSKIRANATFNCDIQDPQLFIKLLQFSRFASNAKTFILGNHFHYLNAERLGPRTAYEIGTKVRNVGWQGEFSISLLSSKVSDTPEYEVTSKKTFPGSKNRKLKSQVNDWMDFIIPGTNLTAKRIEEINKAFAQYNGDAPFNVGFGISYVLPIVTAGLIARPNELLIIENPEAHLHPSGQSRIGAFLAKVASSSVHVIIETHSEHVINGVRLAALKGDIAHENVVINFFDASNRSSQPELRSIELNEQADLTNWPIGFFDQQQQDLSAIFRLKKAGVQ